MRPFFSYYGSKWTGSRHYGAPRHDLVIEPFAGSAGYSTRWACRNVRLYDVSQDIYDLWSWLIGCSADDLTKIPDSFEGFSEVMSLSRGPQLLVRFWVSKGRVEASKKLSPWYFQYRNAEDCRVWGASVKRRIIRQKPILDRWSIEKKPWWEIDVEPAHWHIDPPYNNSAGSKYPCSDLDYAALAEWCRNLPGEVDVCENVGADWLPFSPLYEVVTSRGRPSGAVFREAVWRKVA